MTSPCKLRFGKELNSLEIRDIQFLIDSAIDESQNLDYKQPSENPQKDCDNLAEVISSFLNTDGGIIIYGVSEIKDGQHNIPSQIKGSITQKERLENLLVSRIQPWADRIKILRIKNNKAEEGVFVIEVPKSNNPPHMFNHIYYQRLNYQTKPMEHESVYRAFQTSWLRREDIVRKIIEPIYSEIRFNQRQIENFEWPQSEKYDGIIIDNRYLFDQLEPNIRQEIDKFYDKLKLHNYFLGAARRNTPKFINEELCKVLPSQEEWIIPRIQEDLLEISLSLIDSSGNMQTTGMIPLVGALIERKALKEHLQQKYPFQKIIEIKAKIKRLEYSLTESELGILWASALSQAKQNETYLRASEEMEKLLQLSNIVIKELSI